MKRFFLIVLVVLIAGCDYDVPITSKPTRRIDERLVGNWTKSDGKEHMTARKYDDYHLVVSANGDLFRAYHSDLHGAALITAQDINSPDRKYFYLTWELSADGQTLTLRGINDKVIPRTARTSSAVVRSLKANMRNPELLLAPDTYTRDAAEQVRPEA